MFDFMLLGFKTELYPNNKQKTLLAKHAGVPGFLTKRAVAKSVILARGKFEGMKALVPKTTVC